MRKRPLACVKEERFEVSGLGNFVRCARFEKRGAEGNMKKNMSKQQQGLGGLFDSAEEYEMGEAMGEYSPGFGVLVGGGLATAGLLVAKSMRKDSPRVAKYAGLVALAAGGIPSAAALMSWRTRRAGYLGLATTAIVGLGEIARAMFVEPSLGEYAAEMQGPMDLQILDAGGDMMDMGDYAYQMAAPPAGGLQILGQATPQQAMYGMGAHPMEMGYSGQVYQG